MRRWEAVEVVRGVGRGIGLDSVLCAAFGHGVRSGVGKRRQLGAASTARARRREATTAAVGRDFDRGGMLRACRVKPHPGSRPPPSLQPPCPARLATLPARLIGARERLASSTEQQIDRVGRRQVRIRRG